MSVITAKGAKAQENALKEERIDTSEIYLRLKDGDSHTVRILSPDDYVEYNAVGDFNNGIYNQPVTDDSPFLKAHKEGGEVFDGLYPRKRYVFAFGSVETGKLVAFDASRNQAKGLISTIEEYRDVLDEYAFTFKRTGEKTATTYSLSPKLKLSDKETEVFKELDGEEAEIAFFEQIIRPVDDTFAVKLLAEIDPTVTALFPDINIDEVEESGGDSVTKADEVADIDGDDLPF